MNLLSKVDPKTSGLEQLRSLILAGLQPSIHDTLSLSLVQADEGFVVVEGRPDEHHLNPMGTVHGGWISAISDTACGCAVHSMLPPGTGYTTLELKVSFLRPITPGTGLIRAEGTALTVGRRAAFSEAKIMDAAGKLYATATSSLLVMPLPA